MAGNPELYAKYPVGTYLKVKDLDGPMIVITPEEFYEGSRDWSYHSPLGSDYLGVRRSDNGRVDGIREDHIEHKLPRPLNCAECDNECSYDDYLCEACRSAIIMA